MNRKPKYIPGIYNYCDRWCERCFWTKRCQVYADLEKEGLNAPDFPSDKFWKSLSGNFAKTFKMLDIYMKEHNIVITQEEKEEIGRKHKKLKDRVKEHHLVTIAKNYVTKVDDIVDKWQAVFYPEHIETMAFSQPADPEEYMIKLGDAIEVIQFYHYQIQVKLMRALNGILDEDHPYELPEGTIKDSDGSAAISLMGIDRSMAAWSFLLDQLPNLEDEILECLSILKMLEIEIEKVFPEARNEHSKYWGGILVQC